MEPPSINSDQSKNQLSSNSRMLQALSIETTLIENYGKLKKQLKKHNFVKYNDYRVIIAKLEINIYSIKDITLIGLSKLENLIVM